MKLSSKQISKSSLFSHEYTNPQAGVFANNHPHCSVKSLKTLRVWLRSIGRTHRGLVACQCEDHASCVVRWEIKGVAAHDEQAHGIRIPCALRQRMFRHLTRHCRNRLLGLQEQLAGIDVREADTRREM